MKHSPTPAEIKGARAASGLTQARAAQIVGRTTRNWQQWEAGARKMPAGLFELFKIKSEADDVVRNR